MISETHPENAGSSGSSVPAPLLLLTDYDRDLCRRLALSPKTQPVVKRIARLLLDMARSSDVAAISTRTGIGRSRLKEIRHTYIHQGLQEVLEISMEAPPPRNNRKVSLNDEERAFCELVAASGDPARGRTRRARALLLLEQGCDKPYIASVTGACERTLERLVGRYETHGAIGAVNDAGRCGRPIRYSKEDYVPLIRRVIQQEQPATLLQWTINDLRQSLARHRQEAAEMSSPTLRALIHEAGFQFRSAPGRRSATA